MFRNVSCFVSLDAAFHYIIFYDLLERFSYEFRLGQHSTETISRMSDGGHEKGIGEGSGLTTYKSSHKAIYMIIKEEIGRWIN